MPVPVFSVVVPCFNQGRYLADALTSVREQTLRNWECIIVDDGSTDDTAVVAARFVREDSRFAYVQQRNAGVSSARNHGIRLSRGRYLLPLDGDDRIGPAYLAAAQEVLDFRADVRIVYCRAELFGEKTGPWNLPSYSAEGILLDNCLFCTAAFRRDDFDRVGGYREDMRHGYEDWDFWLSVLSAGGGVSCLPETHFYYRVRLDSRNHTMTAQQYHEMQARIYAHHLDLYITHFPDPISAFKELRRLREANRSCRSTFRMFWSSVSLLLRAKWPYAHRLIEPLRNLARRFCES